MSRTIAHVFQTMREAVAEYDDFCDAHNDEIVKVFRDNSTLIVMLKNGEEHYFMSDSLYSNWCLGRTYLWGEELYHSGVYMRESEA